MTEYELVRVLAKLGLVDLVEGCGVDEVDRAVASGYQVFRVDGASEALDPVDEYYGAGHRILVGRNIVGRFNTGR